MNLETNHNSVCLVTGGSSGIGECVAALMLAKGASVTLVARRKAALEEAALRCRGALCRNRVAVAIERGELEVRGGVSVDARENAHERHVFVALEFRHESWRRPAGALTLLHELLD